MKWYNKKLFAQYLNDIKQQEKEGINTWLPLVIKHTNPINKEEGKIGVFDKNDLIQSGNVGLVEAWKKIDWERINNSDTPNKVLANFLSARITGTIKRHLLQGGVMVAIPEYQIQKTKAEQLAGKLFGNWMYSFRVDDFAPGTTLRYSDILDWNPDDTSSYWETMNLQDKLTDIMQPLRQTERDIMMMNFGINFPKKFTQKEIAKHMRLSVSSVERIKKEALQKLNNQDNREYLKSFL